MSSAPRTETPGEPAFDWQDSLGYGFARRLSSGPWAWEFLRRNPDYQRVAKSAPTMEPKECVPEVTSALTWGLVAFADPGCSAWTASVLWRPDLYASVLPVDAVPAEFSSDTPALEFASLQCRVGVVAASGQRHHLFLGDQENWLQLMLHGAEPTGKLHLATSAIVTWPNIPERHQLLKRLSYLASHGRLASDLYRPHASADRLAHVLQVLDGSLQGASHREIALVMFGAERVARDWSRPGSHLRDHIRRAVQRGRYLMNGGYLELLR